MIKIHIFFPSAKCRQQFQIDDSNCFYFKNLEIWPWEKPKLLKIKKILRPKHIHCYLKYTE